MRLPGALRIGNRKLTSESNMPQNKSKSSANNAPKQPSATEPASLAHAVSLHLEGKLQEALEEINVALENGDTSL